MADQKTVTIYTTPTCHFCHQAKEFFKEKGVEYTENDVSSDAAKRQEMIEMTGQMGVPVIKIGDDVVIGFDKEKVANLVGINE
ncbi:MAG: glutaredoxin family protein [Candidatus Paceibacteria bacterium]